ncbi:zinc finger protein 782-like [Anabrus simplex]|uniref:zinc finger protein 782-like n=1 Tax=Anabrus simplex TaxID=316456 RepID=UPI0035A30C36
MDLEVKIKEEPVCFEETSNTSFDSYKITAEEMHLKEEPKSELAEPRGTQVNAFEASTDIKDEICVEEDTVGQLVTCFKEEDELENVALLTGGHPEERQIHPTRQWALSCYICGSKFSQKCAFLKHLHAHSAKRPNPCMEYDHTSSNKVQLEQRIEDHVRSCDQSNRKFFEKSAVQQQIILPIEKRPRCCPQCCKVFTKLSHLQAHMRSHTGERPYSCDHCGRQFSQKTSVKHHMLTHTRERPHSCAQCKKTFSRMSHLQKHMLTHSGIRQYVCDQCGKRYSHKSAVQQHLRTHAPDRPHSCPQCSKRFKEMRIGISAYECWSWRHGVWNIPRSADEDSNSSPAMFIEDTTSISLVDVPRWGLYAVLTLVTPSTFCYGWRFLARSGLSIVTTGFFETGSIFLNLQVAWPYQLQFYGIIL